MIPVTAIRARSNGQHALEVDDREVFRGPAGACILEQASFIRRMIRGELARNTPSQAELGRILAERIAR